MNTPMFQEGLMDIPADDDSSRRSVLSEVVSALSNQLREFRTRNEPARTETNGNDTTAGSERPAKEASASRPASGPIIRPSAHQKVAIDVHRDDWP
jgi:hypothetical protein